MNTIQYAWEKFQQIVMEKDAPTLQVQEMRIAFYFGAAAMLGITEQIGTPEISEEAGMAMLETLHQEAHTFINSLTPVPR